MSNYIPSEIKIKIFCHLPAKSLIRFRSVSKEWKSLIDSSEFSSDFIVRQAQRKRLFLRLYEDDTKKGEYCRIVDDDDTFPQHMISVRKSVTIDAPYYKHVNIGFGVCPKSLDPKIIRINSVKLPYDYNVGYERTLLRFEIFTLSGGIWRRPLTKFPSKWIEVKLWSKTSVGLNGFVYWHALCMRDYMMMSFDLASEKFTKIHVPRKIARTQFEIFKLRESIGVFRYGSKRRYHVWLMDHDSKSFIKLYTFTTLPITHWRWKVVGFRDNDQLIIEKYGEDLVEGRSVDAQSQLVAYEPNSKQFNQLGFYFGCYSFTSYTESLLLLDQR
ncbi:F-box only protein 8-like [Rutidosis leptorrhynchoides]|uniref:F-box only protein 8-like n=1 Tax=Rutidosis leptorrhynchoides TaxID=125765 RepID=UPI003A98D443